jgi:hypothetical protein
VNSTTSPATTTPVKFADWNIGPVRLSFQPVVFMSLLASAVNGGRPVVEVVISSGGAPSSPTANGVTLVARGVGRNCWNDPTGSVVTVLPIPAGTGHTGLAGTGYPNGYNAWLSAWIYDANGQGASVASSNIQSAAVYFIRYANP